MYQNADYRHLFAFTFMFLLCGTLFITKMVKNKNDKQEESPSIENEKKTSEPEDLDPEKADALLRKLEQEMKDDQSRRYCMRSSRWPGTEALISQLKDGIAKEKKLITTDPENAQVHTSKAKNIEVVLDWISGDEGMLPMDLFMLWAFDGRVHVEYERNFWNRWWPAGRGLEVCAISGRYEYNAKLRNLKVKKTERLQESSYKVET
ncbi:hypothetical protein QBC38DRAFT_549168 [Podospora fimiseda]|uniref:Uncharacterized protein n=1 Tax=Podospora fimiseda TaxID=252190 RepID=A0AAN7BFV8_9PEZI|nr:hypothetical protein QBC38DRAFT_549168 [Podospora fimiseda]